MRVFSVLYSVIRWTMPRRSHRRNRPASFDAQAMSLADLQALPKKSLVLLASARNFATIGTKAQIAQRVFENGLQRANPQDRPRSITVPATLLHPPPPRSKTLISLFRAGNSISFGNSSQRPLIPTIGDPPWEIRTSSTLFCPPSARKPSTSICHQPYHARRTKMAALYLLL